MYRRTFPARPGALSHQELFRPMVELALDVAIAATQS